MCDKNQLEWDILILTCEIGQVNKKIAKNPLDRVLCQRSIQQHNQIQILLTIFLEYD